MVSSGARVVRIERGSTGVRLYFDQSVAISQAITFAGVNSTLSCSQPNGLFELWNGTVWLEASAAVDPADQHVVTVSQDPVNVATAQKVRYAFSDAPFCAVYNQQGLPTPPWDMPFHDS